MRFACLSLFLFCFAINNSMAQKFMQMEKRGSTKVKRYFPGDDIIIKTKDQPNEWQDAVIFDILVDENLLHLGSGALINIDDIIAIKSKKGAAWSKAIATKFYIFSASWSGLSLLATLASWPLTWSTTIIAGGAIVTGWLIHTIFKSRTYKVGKGEKRRLRLLDLSMSPINAYP